MSPAVWLLVIGLVVAVYAGRIWFGFSPPPNVRLLIRIEGDNVRVTRGSVPALAQDHLAGMMMETGVTKGFIGVTPSNRIIFSRHIPPPVQQQIRNVMVNS